MFNYSFFIGVDISKSVIDISYHQSGQAVYLGQFPNNLKGFGRVLKKLAQLTDLKKEQWFVCFENTGIYSKPLLEFLISQAIPCKEESALKISRSLGLRRGKDDKVDSQDICQYAFEKRDSLVPSKLPSTLILRLRKLLARRDFLVRQRQSLKVSLKEQKGFISEEIFQELSVGNDILIDTYDKQIKNLEESIQSLINTDSNVAFNHALAKSVVGIGEITSAYMIAVTENFTTFEDPRKFACYCGVAPFPNRSGTRKGSTRVSHIANKKMKSLFSNCTMSAINFDPEIAKYYKRKRDEGKKAGVVINAVKNKLIQRVFSVIKRQTPYVKLMNYA
jgi:transposase